MLNLNAMLLCDFYKLSHRAQYPAGTETIYSTWTPRASKIHNVDKVVAFGFQAFIKRYLIEFFNDNFFNKPIKEITKDYQRVLKATLGVDNADTSHIVALHGLGMLPLKIKAVPEGTLVPLRVPMLTIENTHFEFFWLTNYIETLISCNLWQMCTSATMAYEFKKLLNSYAVETGGATDFVPFQGHDFSMRGMSSLESAMYSGAGHLLSFAGTDTIPAIPFLEHYYNADITKQLVGTSIPATEHSVQCAYGDDVAYFKHIITKVYPNGPVSIVSDGYDFWKVITEVLPMLKDDILARTGTPLDRVVIRPDSGDPVRIVCGDPSLPESDPAHKGAIEWLWDIFGGEVNSLGYKVLNPKIGLIYGDAITLTRCQEICKQLKDKGFASTNVVYGIGSFTYQYNTRDTFGFALKSTLCVIDGVEKFIFKNPKTDDGTKKSQKGKVAVYKDLKGNLQCADELSLDENIDVPDLLETIFENGILKKEVAFTEIRARLNSES